MNNKNTRTIYLYEDRYDLIITDKKLVGFDLISTHKSVREAEIAAEKYNPDAWVHYDQSIYTQAQYILYGDDYAMLVHDYTEYEML